jgi:hypothetical protein
MASIGDEFKKCQYIRTQINKFKKMKKIFVAATLGLVLVSCGGPSVCDCKEWEKEAEKEYMAAEGADAKKAVEDSWKDKQEQCKKLGEGKSKEEMKAMREEAKNCK